jgi:hypothetical protein
MTFKTRGGVCNIPLLRAHDIDLFSYIIWLFVSLMDFVMMLMDYYVMLFNIYVLTYAIDEFPMSVQVNW